MSVQVLSRNSKTSMPKDGKTAIGYAFWNLIDRIIIAHHFQTFEVIGRENIPASGPFLLVANHSSRWDGPVVQHILNRRANYMVAPAEMMGLQGAAVMSVGAFPAHPRLNPVGYALKQLAANEPVVVFPEGNIFYDDLIHPFKTGVAKIALQASADGMPVPIVPMYIEYYREGGVPSVRVTIGEVISIHESQYKDSNQRDAQVAVSRKLYDEVVALRDGKKVTLKAGTCLIDRSLKCSA